jgi:general stress protein 26
MPQDLAVVAPAFVEMAHSIVWCTVATVDRTGRPRTRVLHPVWEWDGEALTGWIATSPESPKASDLAANPAVSLTYWAPSHDTCTADCTTEWTNDRESRRAGWDRFLNAPPPVGYDPRIVPPWTSPEVPAFGILRLHPTRLRVMPGTLLMAGTGHLLTWRA